MKLRFLALLLCFFWLVPSLGAQSAPVPEKVRQVSAQEAEDREFVRKLFTDDRLEMAQEEGQAYLKKYPGGTFRPEILFILAQVDLRQKHPDKALGKFKGLIEKYSASAYVEEALYLSGLVHLQLKQPKEARDHFSRLVREYPQSSFQAKASYQLGIMAFQDKRWKEAQKHLEKALEDKDQTPRQSLLTRHSLAWSWHFDGQSQKAVKAFVPLLEEKDLSKAQKAEIAFQLGVDAQKQGDFYQAAIWYGRQLQEWPDQRYQNLSRFGVAESFFLLRQKQPDKVGEVESKDALALLNANLNLKKPVERQRSLYYRAWFTYWSGQKQQAEEDFAELQRSSKTYAKDGGITRLRVEMALEVKKVKLAQYILDQALLQKPPRPLQHEWLAKKQEIYFQMNWCRNVIKMASLGGLENDPAYVAPVNERLGLCLAKLDRHSEAVAAFAKVPLGSPSGAVILPVYLQSLQEIKDYPGALRLLEQAKKIPGLGGEVQILPLQLNLAMDQKNYPLALTTAAEIQKLEPPLPQNLNLALDLAHLHLALSQPGTNQKLAGQNPLVQSPEEHAKQADLALTQAMGFLDPQADKEKLGLMEERIKLARQLQDFAKLVSLYQEALPLITSQRALTDVRMEIARLYWNRLKQKDEATKWLLLVVDKGEGRREVHFEAAYLLAEYEIEHKRSLIAKKALQSLVNKLPLDSAWWQKAHFRLGEIHQSLEEWKGALANYAKVLQVKGNNQETKLAQERIKAIKQYLKTR